MDPPRLILYSTPLIATWVLDETHRILFDAGDGAAALLEGRIQKADVVALTHAHRDHVAGLPQLLNLRAGLASPSGSTLRVLHPAGGGSFLALSRFLSQFDPATSGLARWHPLRPQDRLELPGNRFLRAFATYHIPGDDESRPRSIGYQVGRTVERLRPDLRGRPQGEIDRAREREGRAGITVCEEEVMFTVSGDTPALSPTLLQGSRFVLHECTFLDHDADRCADARGRGHEHSCLSEVLDAAASAGVMHLGLYHISKRYSDEEILRAVRSACSRRELPLRVSVALPGRVCSDLFAQCVWVPAKG